MDFEPRILGLLCHWCSYSAADSAGASKLDCPANLRVVRVMCTGRVDPAVVMRAFASGVDGVLVCGCHFGDCHYIEGNRKAAGRLGLLRNTLGDLGVEPDRLRLEWIGATEAERYAEVVGEMTERIRELGPIQAGAGR